MKRKYCPRIYVALLCFLVLTSICFAGKGGKRGHGKCEKHGHSKCEKHGRGKCEKRGRGKDERYGHTKREPTMHAIFVVQPYLSSEDPDHPDNPDYPDVIAWGKASYRQDDNGFTVVLNCHDLTPNEVYGLWRGALLGKAMTNDGGNLHLRIVDYDGPMSGGGLNVWRMPLDGTPLVRVLQSTEILFDD